MQEHILYVRDRLLDRAEARAGSSHSALPKRTSSRSAAPQPSRRARSRLTRPTTGSGGKAKVKSKGLESLVSDPFEQLGSSPASQ
jgi:hypothetical protein